MDLIAHSMARLGQAWCRQPEILDVLVSLRDRAVFVVQGSHSKCVVKVEGRGGRHRAECLALRAAHAAGLPVPAIRHAEPGPPSVLVLAWIDGEPLSPDTPREGWQQAGRVLRRLHTLPAPFDMRRFDHSGSDWRDFVIWWAQDQRASARHRHLLPPIMLERLEQRMLDTFAAMSEPHRVMLHGDCQNEHMLLGPSSHQVQGLIDFGDAGTGDPLWDVAVLTLWASQRLDDVLSAYEMPHHLHAAAKRVVDAYHILRHLAAIGWLEEYGFDTALHTDALRHAADRAEES